jgi:drug/metabolite transporter (DMT)-like permease
MSVAPIASVVALRETSVVFAACIGALFLGESFGRRRIAASIVVMAGLVLLAVASKQGTKLVVVWTSARRKRRPGRQSGSRWTRSPTPGCTQPEVANRELATCR